MGRSQVVNVAIVIRLVALGSIVSLVTHGSSAVSGVGILDFVPFVSFVFSWFRPWTERSVRLSRTTEAA